MSLASELQKLKSLRDSGGITQEEYEKSRNRILEECVRHIEAVHDLDPKACVSGQPSASEPRARFSRTEPQPEANRPSTYSEELDYSLVKPPVQRVPESSPVTCAVAEPPVQRVEAPQIDTAAPGVLEMQTVRPPAQVHEERPAASWGVPAQRVEVSFSSDGAVLDVKEPARRIEVFEKDEAASSLHAPGATVASLPSSLHSDAEPDARCLPAELSAASQAGEADDRSLEDCVPRFSFYDSKPRGRDRWGLPRFKLVHGVVQDFRVSMCQDRDRYAASVAVDGQRMAITSSSEIRIATGDRISLGGYERDGELLVLAYRNDTNGSYSDLSSLRKRYRFLLTIGRLIMLIGLAALAASVMAFLHKPAWTSHFDRWGYVPYVLSGVVTAAICYLGLTLSFVGKWAKDFHKALAPTDTNPEQAAYGSSSIPLALQ